jgi:hypothetical protein
MRSNVKATGDLQERAQRADAARRPGWPTGYVSCLERT